MSKNELYCFKNSLIKIGSLNSLTQLFFFDHKLFSIDENKVTIFDFKTEPSVSSDENKTSKFQLKPESNINILVRHKDLSKKEISITNSPTLIRNDKTDDYVLSQRHIIKTTCCDKLPEDKSNISFKNRNDVNLGVEAELIQSPSEVLISPDFVSIYKLACGIMYEDMKELKNGLCSSKVVQNDKIFLGFENGVVGCLEYTIENIGGFENKISNYIDNEKQNSLQNSNLSHEEKSKNICGQDSCTEPKKFSFKTFVFLKEPVLNLVLLKNICFAHTLSGIYRFPLSEDLSVKNMENNNKGNVRKNQSSSLLHLTISVKELCAFREHLIAFEKNRLIILNENLQITHSFISALDIKRILVHQDSLYVGFECGVVTEYNLSFLKLVDIKQEHVSRSIVN